MIIYHIIGICDETYNIFYFLYIFNGLLLVDTFSIGFKCGFCSYAYLKKLRYDFLGILFIVFLTKCFNSYFVTLFSNKKKVFFRLCIFSQGFIIYFQNALVGLQNVVWFPLKSLRYSSKYMLVMRIMQYHLLSCLSSCSFLFFTNSSSSISEV